jgi:hypothetical protein
MAQPTATASTSSQNRAGSKQPKLCQPPPTRYLQFVNKLPLYSQIAQTRTVSNPPAGAFNVKSPAMKWKLAASDAPLKSFLNCVGAVQALPIIVFVAWIALDRLPDFINGENERGQCNFRQRERKSQTIHYRCNYNDYENAAKKQHVAEQRSRKDVPDQLGTQNDRATNGKLGFSIKRGCTAHFWVKILEGEKLAEIRYQQPNHVLACGQYAHATPEELKKMDNLPIAPFLSDACRTKIQSMLIQYGVRALPCRGIAQEVSQWALHSFCQSHGISDVDALLGFLDGTLITPRDYHVTARYANACRVWYCYGTTTSPPTTMCHAMCM